MDAPSRKTKHHRPIRTSSQDHLRNLRLDRHKAEIVSFKAPRGEDPKKQAMLTALHQETRKRKSSALQKRIDVDLADLENRRRQIARLVQQKARESYSFLPDERQLAKQNALIILTTMEKWSYFCRPTNLAFHDRTIGKVAPKALQLLLGLGVNFCPTPLRPMLNIDKSMERFERDLNILRVFAGSEDLIPLVNPKDICQVEMETSCLGHFPCT